MQTEHDVSFQEFMVDTFSGLYSVAGKVVLEIASDPWLGAAKRFLKHGAGKVIASDISPNWVVEPVPGIETATMDARKIDEVLGRNEIDLVFGINLLEHLQDILRTIRSIAGALRPGGVCLLHGHPIWTSARGHHVMLGYIGSEVTFSDDSNPIPLWGHLYMTEGEMRRELAASEHSNDVIEAAIEWCFKTDLITRTPRRTIIRQISAGPLAIEHLWEDTIESPDRRQLTRIQHGPWWDPEEDYGVRGMTYVLRNSSSVKNV